MKARLTLLLVLLAAIAWACGGPINTGGVPDPNKSDPKKSDFGVGGPVNSGGVPDTKKSDPSKSNGPGGPINTGGAPDVSKSDPKKDGGLPK